MNASAMIDTAAFARWINTEHSAHMNADPPQVREAAAYQTIGAYLERQAGQDLHPLPYLALRRFISGTMAREDRAATMLAYRRINNAVGDYVTTGRAGSNLGSFIGRGLKRWGIR